MNWKQISLLVLAALCIAVFLVRTPDTDKTAMQSKYGNVASAYLTLPSGDKIHYRDEGQATGPSLVMLHGSNSSLHTWEPLRERLGSDFRVVSLDLPGHGLTGPHNQRDYSAAAIHETVLAVLNHLSVEKPIWVGNSMGGWLSWRAAIEHDERVSGLVLISASGAPLDEPRELYLGAKLMQTGFGRWLVPKITPRSIVKSSIAQTYYDPGLVTDELVDRYWELTRYPGNRVATADRALVEREAEYWDRVSEIDVPVLVLWGDKDKVTPTSMSKKYKEAIADVDVVIYPDVAHIAMEEVPDLVANDIRDWYSRHYGSEN